MLTPDELTIDPEFRGLLPAQSEDELGGLRLLIDPRNTGKQHSNHARKH